MPVFYLVTKPPAYQRIRKSKKPQTEVCAAPGSLPRLAHLVYVLFPLLLENPLCGVKGAVAQDCVTSQRTIVCFYVDALDLKAVFDIVSPC